MRAGAVGQKPWVSKTRVVSKATNDAYRDHFDVAMYGPKKKPRKKPAKK